MTKKTQNYQQLKQQLDDIMFNLQREDIGLDEALELYQAGQENLMAIKEYLKTAGNKVSELKLKYKDD